MLSLASTTDPSWVQRVERRLDHLLLDHAHCEKKAASMAINLIFRYQTRPFLLRWLSELAREELEHFELMLTELDRRQIPFTVLDPSPYAGELMKHVRRGEPDRLVDTLLVCSLIEARSCERMKLLSEHLTDEDLRELYKGLLASEARHHRGYVHLTAELVGREAAVERLRELAEIEAAVIARAPRDQVRMHT
ncbi:MAG: tRNA-(ms[2]io[6]A)-hydroxylase [Deltaproteobacteria bacterium]|nr:MAG: tRNA-(ms[2]io[6]A)-hydroxylase [Deltaproteobacteria bacterium]